MILYGAVVIAAGFAIIIATMDLYIRAKSEMERWKARRRRLA